MAICEVIDCGKDARHYSFKPSAEICEDHYKETQGFSSNEAYVKEKNEEIKKAKEQKPKCEVIDCDEDAITRLRHFRSTQNIEIQSQVKADTGICQFADCRRPMKNSRWCDDCYDKRRSLGYDGEDVDIKIEQYNREYLTKQAGQVVGTAQHDAKADETVKVDMTPAIINMHMVTDNDQLKRLGEHIKETVTKRNPLKIEETFEEKFGALGSEAGKAAAKAVAVGIDAGALSPALSKLSPEQLTKIQSIIDGQACKDAEKPLDDFMPATQDTEDTMIEVETQQRSRTMAETNSFEALKEDGQEAAYRLAGKQFTKLTRDAFVAAIAKQAQGDEAFRNRLASFFATDLGEAVLQSMLSLGLSTLPKNMGEHPQILSRELRVQAMTTVGDVAADLIMEPLRQVAVMYLSAPSVVSSLPQESAQVVKAPVEIPITVEAKR